MGIKEATETAGMGSTLFNLVFRTISSFLRKYEALTTCFPVVNQIGVGSIFFLTLPVLGGSSDALSVSPILSPT
jgi:hypothetical protein